MERRRKTVRILLLGLILILCLAGSALADDGGTCGTDAAWSFTEADGALVISGTGEMADYADSSATPWFGLDVMTVTVGEGITRVGSNAFGGLFLDNVVLPESLTSIGSSAFQNCSGLRDVYFAGIAAEWNAIDIGSGNDYLTSATLHTVTASGACGNRLTWKLYGGDTLIISGTGAMSQYYEYDDGDYYFDQSPWDGYSSLRHVIIESGVTSIGAGAFALCKLTDISIPASVTSIGVGAFYGCSSLTGVTIPAGISIIGTETFERCSALTAIEIPSSVTSIGKSAFYNSGLTSVTIPAGVKTIYSSAFSNCYGLTSVTLPDSLTSIGQNAFNYCPALTDVYYRGTPEQYGQIGLGRACFPDSAVIHYAETVATGSVGTLAWTLKDNGLLTLTGGGAVPDYASAAAAPWAAYASSIRLLFLPEELSAVGENAFGSLTGLTDVYFQNFSEVWDSVTVGAGNEPLNVAAFHFDTVRTSGMSGSLSWQLSSSGTLLFTGNGAMQDYSTTSWNSYAPWNPLKYTAYNNTQRIILSEGATSVGKAAFYALDRVNSVSLPSTLRTIGADAFASCSALTEITIPEGVTSIGSLAFHYCSMLTSVTIPETVNSIGANAFSQCNALTDVWFGGTLPEWTALTSGNDIGLPTNVTVHTATKRTQGSCGTNLTWSLWSNGTLLVQGTGAMNDYSSSSSAPWSNETYDRVIIAEGVTSVGDYAFYFSSCADFTLPSTLTRIGSSAFANSRISALALPNCNANLENYAFYYCTYLSSISFGSGAVTIGTNSDRSGSVFHHCDALTSVTIPANVSLEYSYMLFEHCENLETAAVHSPILGSYTFECCLRLHSVNLSGVQTVRNGTFLGTPALTAVTYPASVTEIEGMQFGKQGSNYCGISTVTFMNPDVAITGYNFDGSGGNVQKIVAHECSTGHKFAEDMHKTFQALANDNSAHTWVPAWTWAQDHSSASAAFTCSHCGLTAGPTEAAITSETTEATCTADGVTMYTATVIFGDETFNDQQQEALPALGHTPGEAVRENEVPASCTAEGSYDSAVYCSRCGEELSRETLTIPALGHDVDASTPDWVWAEDLTSAVVRFHCTLCDFYDEVEAEIWDGPTRTEPTHTAEGRIVAFAYADYGSSSYDGDMEVIIPALGHDYAEPQWYWNGVHTEAEAVFVCSCGDTQTVEAIVIVSEDPASHNETGLRTCSAQAEFADTVWEDEYTEVLSLIPHAYAGPVWNWTGDHTGVEAVFTCECGDVQVVDAEITSQITEPTHTADGLAVYNAEAVFGDLSYTDTATETLPALGHEYGAPFWRWAEDGSSAQYVAVCSCGNELITEATVRAGSTTEPTCTQSGQTNFMATVSFNGSTYRDTKTVVYPALGHDYTDAVTEPTCTEQGYTTHTCSRCGDSYVDTYTDALGHDLVHHDAQAGSCTTIGWDAYDTCTRCDYTTYAEIPAQGHDIIHHDAQAASCTAIGWEAYDTCTRCDYTTYAEIAKLEHTPSEAKRENEVAATCKAEGSYDEVTYCTVCGEELSRTHQTIAKLEHTPGEAKRENEVAATYEAEGSYEEVICCAVCGEELSRTRKTIDKLEAPLAITSQPANVTAAAGSTATFKVTATGAASYQWQVSTNGGASWVNSRAGGNKTAILSFTAAAAHNGYLFRCVVTGGGSSIATNSAKLTVGSSADLTITGQPANVSVAAGSKATFTVTATGAVSYQWQVSTDGGNTWKNSGASGNKTATLRFTASAAHNGYLFRCAVKGSGDQIVTSGAAKLTVS